MLVSDLAGGSLVEESILSRGYVFAFGKTRTKTCGIGCRTCTCTRTSDKSVSRIFGIGTYLPPWIHARLLNFVNPIWSGRRDLNSQSFRLMILSHQCIPVPTRPDISLRIFTFICSTIALLNRMTIWTKYL